MTLQVVPIGLREARAFVEAHHRHNAPPRGHRFSVAVANEEGAVVGVAIVGNPVARMLMDGRTLEVVRTCTDGSRNANSMLYGAAWRAARAMGYTRLVTYTQLGETGASLRAVGWKPVAELAPTRGWDRPSRPRDSEYISTQRTRWEITI